MRIKDSVSNVLSISFVALLFLLAFTWIVFDFNNSSSSLKDTLSIVSSFFGGITTLIAAYIASLLFNDWKEAQRFDIAKNVLIELIKLKSHIDKNYQNARNHLDSYLLENQYPPPSTDFINQRIKAAKACLPEREKHIFDAKILLTALYEKIDIYQITCNEILIKEEDRDFNFPNHIFQISSMYAQALKGNLEDVEISILLGSTSKRKFESEFYNSLIDKLKNKAQVEV